MKNDFIGWRLAQAIVCLFIAASFTACGGGGGGGGSAGGSGTTSFTSGSITGFGSVIINGIRFDDSSSSVSDDDDSSRSRDDLRLGMSAEVEGSQISTDDTGRRSGSASTIRFGSEIVGPVSNVGTSSLVVLGQTIEIISTTVFDNRLPNGLASIQLGNVVEVHGLPGASAGQYTATRIEPKTNPQFYKLRGVVSNLDSNAKTFKIGTETISYASITGNDLPSNLANGLRVRVKLQTVQDGGVWIATKVKSGVRSPGQHGEAEMHGIITDFTSKFAFSVNGVPVNATNAAFPKGDSGIVLGARVEVKGSAVDGTIVATRVKPESDDDISSEGFELHGTISEFNAVAKTFKLRGVTVNYATIGGGVVASLADGVKVEVKGIPSSDHTTLNATRIKLED
jgi:Domain of unknown function (DUF5666)